MPEFIFSIVFESMGKIFTLTHFTHKGRRFLQRENDNSTHEKQRQHKTKQRNNRHNADTNKSAMIHHLR
ncbi:Uncharacterised protein [Vibrio cholerae]|nr:Uncharacterised protein [Vibrio cholerae]